MTKNSAAMVRIRKQLRATKGPCHICGGAIDYTLKAPNEQRFEADHVLPASKGGKDELKNVKPSHMRCNRDKSDRIVPRVIRRSTSLQLPTL